MGELRAEREGGNISFRFGVQAASEVTAKNVSVVIAYAEFAAKKFR
jgi:hypothetical protein